MNQSPEQMMNYCCNGQTNRMRVPYWPNTSKVSAESISFYVGKTQTVFLPDHFMAKPFNNCFHSSLFHFGRGSVAFP